MACNSPGGTTGTMGDTSSCETECWAYSSTSDEHGNINYGPEGKGCEANAGMYACTGQQHGCTNDCTTDCSACYDKCGNACYGTASCSGCGGSCGGCSGSCSGSCSGCTGSCSGGCEGSCDGDCNSGCTSTEQENNAKVALDRVINVDNVKDIFKFVISEVRRFGGNGSGELLNSQTATVPKVYKNIVLSKTYTEDGAVKNCEYYEKTISQDELPLTIEAYRDIYIDDNNKIQYGFKDDTSGLQEESTKPKQFIIGSTHWATDLENYYFDLNKNGNNIYRYKSTDDKLLLKVQEYKYSIEEINEYDRDKLFLLYYNIPRLFENAFKTINKEVPISSGTLIEDNGEYVPILEGVNTSKDWKHYGDIDSAKTWIKMAKELYNTVIPVNDAR